jgi:DNA-binding beta-propeller fold protein YncE
LNTISGRRISRRLAAFWLAISAALISASLWMASGAAAAELLYYDNYGDDTIAGTNIDGSGGGLLNLTGVALKNPEGMAYDPVTNRLIVASAEGGPGKTGEIIFVNLDGSGAGVLNTAGAPVDSPLGVAIDPATRRVYWLNGGTVDSVAYASLDGTGGAPLNTAGATFDEPFRIGLDPVGGKVYWANFSAVAGISFANTNNSGGGNLSVTPAPEGIDGFAVDPAAGRLYWINDGSLFAGVSFTGLAGGSRSDIAPVSGTFKNPYGIAVDPSRGRIYWGNYDNNNGGQAGAIGFADLAGGGGAINVSSPASGPQDPVILKSPSGTEAPKVTRAKGSRSKLSCSTGAWAADYPGSYVYQSPRSFAYQWARNGKAVAGATAPSFSAKSAGKYTCTVTATNQAGAASQASAPVNVKAAKVKLTTKKKATGKAGGVATFKVKGVNQGDLQTKKVRVCVKLPKKAKGALKASKCATLGKLKGRAKKIATLKVKVSGSAAGSYKLSFTVHGSAGIAAKATILVK